MKAVRRNAIRFMLIGGCLFGVSACQEVASLEAQVLIDASVRNELCADGCVVKVFYESNVRGHFFLGGGTRVVAQLCGRSELGVLLETRLSFRECPVQGEVVVQVQSLKDEIAAGAIGCATVLGDALGSTQFPSLSADNIVAERRVPVLEGVKPRSADDPEQGSAGCNVEFPPVLRFGFVSD